MTKERLNYLLDRYLNNTATAAELAEYNAWYEEQGAKGLHLYEKEEEAKVYADELFNNIRNSIQYEEYQAEQARKKKVVVLYRWLSAAAVLVVVSSVLLFFNLRRPARAVVAATSQRADSMIRVVAPGARVGYTASFDQEPLPAVLKAIAKGYQVQIRYDKQALTDRVFSGSIRATDSLEQVLLRIAALHNLTIQPITKGYIVTSHL